MQIILKPSPLMLKILFFGITALVAYLTWILGWLFSDLTWIEATGFHEIPVDQRPPLSDELNPGFTRDRELEPEDTPRLHWLGHAGFLLSWKGTSLLVDPNLNNHCTIAKRLFPVPVAPENLPPIDAVLLSHAHFDHLDAFSLRGIRKCDQVLIPKGNASHLPESAARVHEVELGTVFHLGELSIIPVPAKHNGGRFHPLKAATQAVGYVITDGSFSIYFAGDTGFGPHFEMIGRFYQPDVSVLPIGAYSPSFPLKFFHLNPEDAISAARILKTKLVIPCHFGTFRLSLDSPREALPWFARLAHEHHISWQIAPLYHENLAGL